MQAAGGMHACGACSAHNCSNQAYTFTPPPHSRSRIYTVSVPTPHVYCFISNCQNREYDGVILSCCFWILPFKAHFQSTWPSNPHLSSTPADEEEVYGRLFTLCTHTCTRMTPCKQQSSSHTSTLAPFLTLATPFVDNYKASSAPY